MLTTGFSEALRVYEQVSGVIRRHRRCWIKSWILGQPEDAAARIVVWQPSGHRGSAN